MFLHVYKFDHESLQNRCQKVNINDGNNIHKMLAEACDSNRKDAGLLYRFVYKRDEILLYIQTCKEMDNHIMESYGFYEIKKIDMEEKLDNIKNGDVVRFNIKVFPSKYEKIKKTETEEIKETKDTKKRDKTKQYIKDEKERYSWMIHNFNKNGLQLKEQQLIEKNVSMIKFKKDNKTTAIKNNEYEGYATITDKESFKKLVSTGLGKCKNYGLGLLLII